MMQLGAQMLNAEARAAQVAQGVALIRKAAAIGHAEACCMAATLAAAGVGQAADLDLALDLLEHGARLGSKAAQGQLQVLAEAPDDAPQDWTRLRAAIGLERWRTSPERRVLREQPRIRALAGVIPGPVCAWLITRAAARLRPAETFNPGAGMGRQEPGRTNRAAAFDLTQLDVVVVLLRSRIARIVGTPPAALETSQVLHYGPGERFAPHYDFLDPAVPGLAAQAAQGGQRIATVLVYLNGGYSGGETAFPRVGLRHRGAPGDALMFANVDRESRVDPLTLHAGEAPREGEKWVFSQWIRDRTPAAGG